MEDLKEHDSDGVEDENLWKTYLEEFLKSKPNTNLVREGVVDVTGCRHFGLAPDAQSKLATALPVYAALPRVWPKDPCHHQFTSAVVAEDFLDLWNGHFIAMYKVETNKGQGKTHLRLALMRDGATLPLLLVAFTHDKPDSETEVSIEAGPKWERSSEEWNNKQMFALAARILHRVVRAAARSLPLVVVDAVASHCYEDYQSKHKGLMLDLAMVVADRVLLRMVSKECVALAVTKVGSLLKKLGQTEDAAFVFQELAESDYPVRHVVFLAWALRRLLSRTRYRLTSSHTTESKADARFVRPLCQLYHRTG